MTEDKQRRAAAQTQASTLEASQEPYRGSASHPSSNSTGMNGRRGGGEHGEMVEGRERSRRSECESLNAEAAWWLNETRAMFGLGCYSLNTAVQCVGWRTLTDSGQGWNVNINTSWKKRQVEKWWLKLVFTRWWSCFKFEVLAHGWEASSCAGEI